MTSSRNLFRGAVTIIVSALLLIIEPLDVSAQSDDEEAVSDYTIHVEDSMMAFVRADATVIRDGRAHSRNIDYFTLVRESGTWKFLSASYVAKPIDEGP